MKKVERGQYQDSGGNRIVNIWDGGGWTVVNIWALIDPVHSLTHYDAATCLMRIKNLERLGWVLNQVPENNVSFALYH